MEDSKKSLKKSEQTKTIDTESNYDRGQWKNQIDFIVTMVACAVGLGNVWRFPYLCFKNGGGTFLVAYVVTFSCLVIPTFLMEVSTGQYTQQAALGVWILSPIFRGVGIGNLIQAFMCCSYYCVIVSWCLYYMVSSFNSTFPWETCDNWWNTENCIVAGKPVNLTIESGIASNTTINGTKSETSVVQFWEFRVLQQSDSVFEFGGIQYELLGLLFVAWVIVFISLRKGITKARKFIYFCALSPYVLLVTLMVRGLTLPGAMVGLKYYFTPNFTKLLETTVWRDAGTQVLYSYGIGNGALIALGSHNSFNQNCLRDSFITCGINGLTSFLAGFVVFPILGFVAVKTNKDVNEVVKKGVGLVFQAYPEVASNLPLKQFWAVLFFFMTTILGLDTQVCLMEGLVVSLEDTFPSVMRKHKSYSLAVMCLALFLLGILMVTKAGSYWLTIFDSYGASGLSLLFIVFFETIGFGWGFGTKNLRYALKRMINVELSRTWDVFWKFIAPASTAVIFILCIIKFEPMKYPSGENYPFAAELIGICLALCSMLAIPLYAIYHVFIREGKGSLKERFIQSFKTPTKYVARSVHCINDSSPDFIKPAFDSTDDNKINMVPVISVINGSSGFRM